MKQLPLYEQVHKMILKQIDTGEYPPGGRLPSEKELEKLYHVSRITAQKAMNLLAEDGRIVRLPGKGSFVIDNAAGISSASSEKQPLIGLILDEFSPSFAYHILHSIQSACEEEGYSMVLRCSSGSLERETKAIEDLVALGVQGLIIMCVHDENYNERILQLVLDKFPVVTIDRQLKGLSVPFVGTDNVSAARELTCSLLKQGFRSIALVRPKAHETVTLLDRQKGFQQAFNDYGLVANESLWITNLRSSLPESAGEAYWKQDISIVDEYLRTHLQTEAFMVSEYTLARILKYCLQKAGRYRDDMIACFDSPESFLEEAEFTHVAQDENAIGRTSMELLLKTIRGQEHPSAVLVPYQIIQRHERNWG